MLNDRLNLAEILQHDMNDAARLSLRHERVATFRWVGLLEVAIYVSVGCCCVLPLVVIGSVLAGDLDLSLDFGEVFSWDRLHHHWHELVVVALNADGEVVASTRKRLLEEAEGEALLAAILMAADREGLVVIESVGQASSTPMQVWYGGRPMLAEPGLVSADRIAADLGQHGCEIREYEGHTILSRKQARRSKFWLSFQLLFLGAGLPVVWLIKPLRDTTRTAWLELRGEGPPSWSVKVAAREICFRQEQGDYLHSETRIAGERLVGASWSRRLSYGDQARVGKPSLRMVITDGVSLESLPVFLGARRPCAGGLIRQN